MPNFLKDKKTLSIGEKLIGFLLCRKIGEKIIKLPITEIEVYDGPFDLASHASRGKTLRNSPMFDEGGIWYIYLIYGNHWMLNIVTGPKNYPAAILIRGVREITGPGKLTRYLKIDNKFNGKEANKKTGLWIEENKSIQKIKFKKTIRIGIEYAGPIWSKKLYRIVADTIKN